MKRCAKHIRRFYRLREVLNEIHPERDYFAITCQLSDVSDDFFVYYDY